ncbi:MAG: glycosyltransferase, partial [Clostridia bacterium]|nr:glycosyltransferase [Clostridia bacterium]
MDNKIVNKYNNLLLSIIIPAYNVEKYIGECLDSLTRQNFNASLYEVIIINDGSTDSTEKIALEYSSKYNYIKVFSQTNQGVSIARNTGLKIATGKYVTFLDSDDFVSDNIYINIIEMMEKNCLEGFYFGKTSKIECMQSFDNTFYFPTRENSCKMSVCRVVFLKDIISKNNLCFSKDIKYNEDFLFNYKYIQLMSSSIAGSARCLYYVRERVDSATAKIRLKDNSYWPKYYNSLTLVANEIKNFTNANNLPKDKLYYSALSSVLQTILWGARTYKKNAKKVLLYLKDKKLILKYIKGKQYYG